MLIVLVLYFIRVTRVFLFWMGFTLTRPFGAAMGDVPTKDPGQGGMGFGTVGFSAVLAALLVAVVRCTMRRDRAPAACLCRQGDSCDPQGRSVAIVTHQSVPLKQRRIESH